MKCYEHESSLARIGRKKRLRSSEYYKKRNEFRTNIDKYKHLLGKKFVSIVFQGFIKVEPLLLDITVTRGF